VLSFKVVLIFKVVLSVVGACLEPSLLGQST
jgi:hypothetical protein